MITVSLVQDESTPRTDLDVDDISEVIKDPDAVMWVDVLRPMDEEIAIVDREFDIHPLALQALRHTTARPEIDFYDSFIYLNFYVVHPTSDMTLIEPRLISFFVGSNYLVTVHDEPLRVVEEVHRNWTQSTAEVGDRRIGLLLYSILDSLVDQYFATIDSMSDTMENLEDAIFQAKGGSSLQQLFDFKNQVMAFRRIVAPERDVLNALIRGDSPMVDRQTSVYMQDVYDHLLRVIDSLDNYRDLLSNILDAHLSVTSNRLNHTMKTLAASSTILMSMTLVASIYGMNFDHIPELSWRFGYWWALGLMASIGFSLIYAFRKIDWI
ncbi:magnesium/cobalt transporter CorA [soil metagenome]